MWHLLYHCAKFGWDYTSHAGFRRKQVLGYVFTGRPTRSAAMPVLLFTQWSKNGFFAPRGRHIAPINVKFGTGERTAGLLPRGKFHVCEGKKCGNTAPKTVKISVCSTLMKNRQTAVTTRQIKMPISRIKR